MSNRKLPQTSLDAYEKAKDMIQPHHQKILSVLRVISKANYEEIATRLKMDRHAVGRRMKELEERQLVYKPGTKSKTKSGRDAYDYMITDAGKNVEVGENNEYVVKENLVPHKKKEILPAAVATNLFDL